MATMRFLEYNVWRRITAKVKRCRSRCHVAIAYFGEYGSTLLPLTRGSVLVVNASEAAVKAGQTHPGELLKLINKGVAVHSVANLHAKVIVAGDDVFVGSTNASRRSAKYLLEAAVRTSSRTVILAARQMVTDLAVVAPLGPERARQLLKIYRPPRVPLLPPAHGSNQRVATPLHDPLWLVRTKTVTWNDEDFAAERNGLPTAWKRLQNRRRFEVDSFSWDSRGLQALRRGDQIICMNEDPDGRTFVTPAGTVLHVEPYARSARRMIFFEVLKGGRRRSVERVRRQLGPAARSFLNRTYARRVPDTTVHEILVACGRSNR
jgi:hypothetical protein